MARSVAATVLCRVFGSSVRKSVALVLADHADGTRWATIVGQKTIAAESELGVRSVRRVLADFEREGLIVRARRHREDGTRTSDEIRLVESAILALPATQATRQESTEAASATTGQTGHRSESADLPATQAETTGQSLAAHEPSEEPSGEPPSLRSGNQPATEAGSQDELFEAIVWVCFGVEWVPGETRITSRERGMANRAAKELRDVGATPDEVIRRARHFFAWVGQRPTPDNLVTHWNRLNDPQQRATAQQMKQFEHQQTRAQRRREITEEPQ